MRGKTEAHDSGMPLSGPLVFVVEGEDQGARAEAREAILTEFARAREKAHSELAVERFEGDEELAVALMAASTPSLTGDERVILFECKSLDAREADDLCGWLGRHRGGHGAPPDALVVISCERAPSAATRKRLESCGVRFRSPERPSYTALPSFIQRLASENGLELTSEAAAYLGSALGNDPSAIRSAIAQLLDAYPPEESKGRLGPAEVEALFDPATHDTPWRMVNAVERGHTAQALIRLEGLLAEGYHPLQVLAILYTSFRRVGYLASAGAARKELLASLRLPERVKGEISKLARRLGPDRASRAITAIAKAEVDMKGASGLGADVVVEKLLVELCDICR